MGYIYSAAVSVIIVLQGPIWKIIETAATGNSPSPFAASDLHTLEEDPWVSRVWTYQELVNGADTYFTTTAPNFGTPVVQVQRFLNCVGASLSRWRREHDEGGMGVLVKFPRLNILQDVLGDILLNGYLERTALNVLSNIGLRDVDRNFPQNRLLACLEHLSDKVMKICEARNDYSFIYTSDERSRIPGERWRPRTSDDSTNLPAYSTIFSTPPANLTPIINWHSSPPELAMNRTTTQTAHQDSSGFWLDNMVRLRTSDAVDESIVKQLDRYLFGYQEPENPTEIQIGIFNPSVREVLDWKEALLNFLVIIGFTGCYEPQTCENGLFYSQIDIRGHQDVELFAAASIAWKFGNPGMARWNDNGVVRYCAGVYAGVLKLQEAESILMV
ncbi:hypothetical protein V8E51_015121 [Hyaloscypha variabilis]